MLMRNFDPMVVSITRFCLLIFVLGFHAAPAYLPVVARDVFEAATRVNSDVVHFDTNATGVRVANLGSVPCSTVKKVRFSLTGPLVFFKASGGCRCRQISFSSKSIGMGESAEGEFSFRAPAHSSKSERSLRMELVNEAGERMASLVFKYFLDDNLSVGERQVSFEVPAGEFASTVERRIPVVVSKPIRAQNLTCAVNGDAGLHAEIREESSGEAFLVLKASPLKERLEDLKVNSANVTVSDSETGKSREVCVVIRHVPAVSLISTVLTLREDEAGLVCRVRFVVTSKIGFLDGDESVRCSVDGQAVTTRVERTSGNSKRKLVLVEFPRTLLKSDAASLKAEVFSSESSSTIVHAKIVSSRQ